MRFQKKLTKRERNHLVVACGCPSNRLTLKAFKAAREAQHEIKAKDGIEPCYDCRQIAIKLGLES